MRMRSMRFVKLYVALRVNIVQYFFYQSTFVPTLV